MFNSTKWGTHTTRFTLHTDVKLLLQNIHVELTCLVHAVKYEARLEDGTVVSKSDGVEFYVKDG